MKTLHQTNTKEQESDWRIVSALSIPVNAGCAIACTFVAYWTYQTQDWVTFWAMVLLAPVSAYVSFLHVRRYQLARRRLRDGGERLPEKVFRALMRHK